MTQSIKKPTSLVQLHLILGSGKRERVKAFFTAQGIAFCLRTRAQGMAGKRLFRYFGLGDVEKDVFFCLLDRERALAVCEALRESFQLDKPGRGIAYFIPIERLAGFLAGRAIGQFEPQRGGSLMQEKTSHSLIVTIMSHGHSADVMDTAVMAGATGGTTLHARGMRTQEGESFLGVSIEPEKEMLYIIAETHKCQAIMQAIVQAHGAETDARAVVFTMPVEGVVGLTPFPGENQ